MKKKSYIGIIGLLVVLLLSCENIVKGNGKQNISFSMNEEYSSVIQRSLEKNKNYTENSSLKIEYGLLRDKKVLSSVTKSMALKALYNTVFDISDIPFGNNYFIYMNIFFDDILIYSAISDRLIVSPNSSELNINLSLKQNNSNVEYILNGGEFSQTQRVPNSYFINSNIVLPIPSKKGHVFAGWFINKDFNGDKITSIGKNFFKGDIVLYAKWNKETSLDPTVTEPTNKSVDVRINIAKSLSEVKTVKFATGVQTADYFTNGGTVIEKTGSEYRFTAEENGDYTVFIQYYDGKLEIKTINISNIDIITVSLNPTVTEPELTNKAFDVIVNITKGISEIKTVKFATGEQKADYFTSGGTIITKTEGGYKFSAEGNGFYTVFVENNNGIKEVKTIKISNIDAITVSLTPTVTEPTNKAFDVIVNITKGISEIKTVKFAKGGQTADYFTSNGTIITKTEGGYKFSAEGNGDYTIFVENNNGIKEVKTINISNIDVVTVSLTPTGTEPTNKDVDVIVNITKGISEIKTVKFAKGIQTVGYFTSNGTSITKTEGGYKFSAKENGDYTVFVENNNGIKEVKTIKISNIDKDAPGTVTNLKGVYTSGNQEIKLTWTLPQSQDQDIKEIQILQNGNPIGTITPDKTEYIVKINKASESSNTFTVIVCDQVGNKSSVIADISPSFTAFKIPIMKNVKKGQTITATVTGSNFKVNGLIFDLTCAEQPSIVASPNVTIVDDTTLNVTLTVPELATGSYTVNIACGENNLNGTFNLSEPVGVGDIILNDGSYVSYATIAKDQKDKAIAVVFDVKAEGKILGLGLEESSELVWAKEGTKGCTTNFEDINCNPDGGGSLDVNKISNFTGDTDGSNNWSIICNVDKDGTSTPELIATNYPAFDWVNKYGTTYSLPVDYQTDWYMPSISELTQIYKNRIVLNAALGAVTGGKAFNHNNYWSSSESGNHNEAGNYCAWGLQLRDNQGKDTGYLSNFVKKYSGWDSGKNVCVRVIRAF